MRGCTPAAAQTTWAPVQAARNAVYRAPATASGAITTQPGPSSQQVHNVAFGSLHASRAAQPRAATTYRTKAPLPEPASHQQTLRRSFIVGGVGLHSGEYAVVRVMPAMAGEGRYFVRVPPGTNRHLWELEQPAARSLEEVVPSMGHGVEQQQAELNADLFFEFVESQEKSAYGGTFVDFFQQRALPQTDSLFIDAEVDLLPEEEPIAGQPDEHRVAAHVANLQQGHRWCSVLQQGSITIWSAEHLLAALECCGVDNARIEIEGGKEVPVVDGSALGWAVDIQRAGLRAAPADAFNDTGSTKRIALPQEVITVRSGEAFITFYPGPSARVTVGVDCSGEAPVIGRQWFSWSPDDPGYQQGDHFRFALAPARTWFPSPEAVQVLISDGMLQGGPDYIALIGHGEDWYDPTMVRFPGNEAARHAVIDLLGDVALLASPGGRGLPAGHIVAYRPDHALQAAFVQRLWQHVDGTSVHGAWTV